MKKLLFLPLFLFSILFAQNDEDSDTTIWNAGIYIGAGQASRTVKVLDPTILPQIIEAWKDYQPIIGGNIGITLGRKLTNQFWLETGIHVNRLGIKRPAQFHDSPTVEDSMLVFNSNEGVIKSHFYYLNIPLLAKLYVNQGPIRGFIFLGPQANFELKEHFVIIENPNEADEERREALSEGSKNFLLALVGGVGGSISISERMALELRLTGQKDILPFVKRTGKFQHYYIAGNIGLSLDL